MTATSAPQSFPIAPDANPSFDKPWHAEAFGLAVAAHQADLFGWKEWVRTFAGNSRNATAAANEQSEAYYEDWLGTLEHLLTHHGIVDPAEVQGRVEDWRRAYLNTPHGEPVVLESRRAAVRECALSKVHSHHHHGKSSRPGPVFISPARTT